MLGFWGCAGQAAACSSYCGLLSGARERFRLSSERQQAQGSLGRAAVWPLLAAGQVRGRQPRHKEEAPGMRALAAQAVGGLPVCGKGQGCLRRSAAASRQHQANRF